MRRREFLWTAGALALPASAAVPPPVPEPHFPSRLYQFAWRNWELANTSRMAEVLGTTPARVLALGQSMGLPQKRVLTADQLRRIYITVIRQNWHLLPNEQIIALLGWTPEKFAFTLKEDDFLDVKLGPKPACARLTYAEPTPREREQAARVRAIVRQTIGRGIDERGEDLFQFVKDLSDTRYALARDSGAKATPEEADLTSGWQIVAPQGTVLAAAARRFERYLATAMAARPGTGKTVRLAVDRSLPGFRVEVRDTEVRVTGRDEDSVLAALHSLEDRMELREGPFLPKGTLDQRTVWNPRFLYSYFALYGDPLMEPESDPFPDGYLEKLARTGINGVWMQAVLNTLAPSNQFPEFGEGSETRLKNLNALVRRARDFGMRVFLYINEPRAMPDAFFRKHPEIRGSSFRGLNAMCTSVPSVREWISDSLAHVFARVPELGGIFSITMSENHTNCFSHGGGWGKQAPNAGDCPRCSKRTGWDTIGELLRTFRDGVRRSSPTAEVIAWDWGWGDDLSANLIPLLPRDGRFQSISEWDKPVHRGGVDTKVGEYSISVVGPGPRATRNWDRARQHGIRTAAKTQFNNTWEISAVPYVPVPNLILEHCEGLAKAGVSGIQASWTCGGYPSPNLAAARAYYFEPRKPRQEILAEAAAQRYGKAAAPDMVEAWRRFSTAFQEYPYGVAVYIIPTQHGPANLLRLKPTGCPPSMILFPQDDIRRWSGAYPPAVVQAQFAKMAALWKEGLAVFRKGSEKVSASKRRAAALDLAIAETCYNHFQSTANQVEFYLLRAKAPRSAADTARMRALAEAEIELARRQYVVARHQSTIAYEASNHYYYTPLDLVEKILNCRQVLGELSVPA